MYNQTVHFSSLSSNSSLGIIEAHFSNLLSQYSSCLQSPFPVHLRPKAKARVCLECNDLGTYSLFPPFASLQDQDFASQYSLGSQSAL